MHMSWYSTPYMPKWADHNTRWRLSKLTLETYLGLCFNIPLSSTWPRMGVAGDEEGFGHPRANVPSGSQESELSYKWLTWSWVSFRDTITSSVITLKITSIGLITGNSRKCPDCQNVSAQYLSLFFNIAPSFRGSPPTVTLFCWLKLVSWLTLNRTTVV